MYRLFSIACLAMGIAVLPALGQTYEVPPPQMITEQSMLWEWLFGLTFLVGCLVVGFKPAKRSNLQ
jgi:hypothetical protein